MKKILLKLLFGIGILAAAASGALAEEASSLVRTGQWQADDTSWLVPLGLGLQHTLNNGVGLYGAFLLNLTDLDTGRGTEADVMPGVTFGAQF